MPYNPLQAVKRDMYAMRNGIVADSLRKAGSPYRFIMGVNIPQLREIAARYGSSAELSSALRADTACRESRLMAPMVTPKGLISEDDALEWIAAEESYEAIDALCHALLRYEPYALRLAERCLADGEERPMVLYGGIRLLWNLVGSDTQRVAALAAAEEARGRDVTRQLAAALVEECRWLSEA